MAELYWLGQMGLIIKSKETKIFPKIMERITL